MVKKIASEIGCGFFDQLDLQLLNDYKFSVSFCDYIFNFFGGM